MNSVVWVALGGAIGSVLRYVVAQWIGVREAPQFPWHTFSINVLGCMLIGVVWALVEKYNCVPALRFFLMTGILGGFTTFSSFGLETIQLIQAKAYLTALGYVIMSNTAGVMLVLAAYQFTSA